MPYDPYGADERRDSRYMDDDEYRRMREAEDDEYEYHGDAADDSLREKLDQMLNVKHCIEEVKHEERKKQQIRQKDPLNLE